MKYEAVVDQFPPPYKAKTEYKCVMLAVHHKSTGHIPGYFEDALQREASQRWRFIQAVRIDDLRFTLIFERMDG